MALAVASLPASAASPASTPPPGAAVAAARMLAGFLPPPGAVRVATAPGQALRAAPERPGNADLVTRTGFWLAAGRPQAVLAWIEAHRPAGLAWTGRGQLGERHRAVVLFAEFSAPPAAGLAERTLVVSVAPAGTAVGAAAASDVTGIRVDAQVTWMPAKPAAERIPAAAREITVTFSGGDGDGDGAGRARTWRITDAATVARVKAIADGLPLVPPGLTHCPADLGRQVEFVFRAERGGPVLATVVASTGGCGTATVAIGGHAYPPLWHAGLLAEAVTGRALPGGRLAR
jgi:hypothetical protein